MALRFAVGKRVMCRLANKWPAGTIIALDYWEIHWPLGEVHPYQVKLDDGSLASVPEDDDYYCREIVSSPPLVYYNTQPFFSILAFNQMSNLVYTLDEYNSAARAAEAALDIVSGHTRRKEYQE